MLVLRWASKSIFLSLWPTDISLYWYYFLHLFPSLSLSEKGSKPSRTGELSPAVMSCQTRPALKSLHTQCRGKMRDFQFCFSDPQARISTSWSVEERELGLFSVLNKYIHMLSFCQFQRSVLAIAPFQECLQHVFCIAWKWVVNSGEYEGGNSPLF